MTFARPARLLLAALLVGAAASAAVLLNLLLLGRANAANDPVGQLRPRLASLPPATAPAARTRTPLVLPKVGAIENEGADD